MDHDLSYQNRQQSGDHTSKPGDIGLIPAPHSSGEFQVSHLSKFPLFSRWDIKIWMRRRILTPPIFLSQKDIPVFLILFLSRKTFSEFLNFPVGWLVVAFVAQIQYSPSLPFSPPYGRSWVISELWIWWTKRNFKPFYHSIYNRRWKFPTLLWYIYTYFNFWGYVFLRYYHHLHFIYAIG